MFAALTTGIKRPVWRDGNKETGKTGCGGPYKGASQSSSVRWNKKYLHYEHSEKELSMKKNILTGVLLGIGAGIIDLIPMFIQGLTWDAKKMPSGMHGLKDSVSLTRLISLTFPDVP